MTNRLYYGDNLAVLRDHIPDDSVDPIYLDPPECQPHFPFDHFDSEGAAIATALCAALPGWTVAHQRCWRPDAK